MLKNMGTIGMAQVMPNIKWWLMNGLLKDMETGVRSMKFGLWKNFMTNMLKVRQAYPLELKVEMSKARIREWHKHWHGKVYVAFSGGKDSTALLHLVRSEYPDVVAVFADTGLEYPEIRKFVHTIDNVIWVKPKMSFPKVIEKYGFPIISKETSQKISEARTTKSAKLLHIRLFGKDNKYKSGKIPNKWQFLLESDFKISHKCCDILKKNPSRRFEKETGLKPMTGIMAKDSHLRKQKYLRKGCNSFEGREESIPLAFWTEKDIWDYINKHQLSYSSIYDMGYENTGCMWCMFGVHLEKSGLIYKNRFQKMKKTHPRIWNYCINKLGIGKVLSSINVNYN